MPPDRQNMILVDAFRAGMRGPPFELARMRAMATPPAGGPRNDADVSTEDRLIPGPQTAIPIRTYRPRRAEPIGALVYFHGGGFVSGGLETCDALCRELTLGAGCVTVSVDYRLAPEHPFPAGLDDAHAATRWTMANAEALGAPTGKVAVAGDSAGGNFATVVSMLRRDAMEPMPIFQLLLYPGVNLALDTPERRALSELGYVLTPDLIDWLNAFYCQDASQLTDPRCAPVYATDLSGLPPALVIVGEFDPMRVENLAYVERLKAAGVKAAYSQYAGSVHGFVSAFSFIDTGRQAVGECVAALRAAFAAQREGWSSPE